MQEIPKLGLDPDQGGETGREICKGEKTTHDYAKLNPNGKLKRSLETKAETASQHQVKFK